MRWEILVPLALLVAGTASAHPGTLGRDGCHACRQNCEKQGLVAGARHCHPERNEQSMTAATAATGHNGSADKAGTRNVAPVPVQERIAAFVVRVTDGDTFTVKTSEGEDKIRVLGIDCPESSHNAKCERDGKQGRASCDVQVPRGVDAKRVAQNLVEGKSVTLEGPFSRDPFGRRLAYVRLADGRDYGLLMVREGRCEDFGWKYPHPRSAAYRSPTP